MKETKSNILNAALKLFNQNGFVNVRLQHIADEAFVSVGNLAYHFENKQELLLKLYERVVAGQIELLNELNIVPLFENLDRHWKNIYQLQSKYRFFYIDTLEILRSNEDIASKHQKHLEWETSQYGRILDFNISRGAFNSLYEEEDKVNMAELICMRVNLGMHQYTIRNMDSEQSLHEFRSMLWTLLSTLFTETGRQEYEQLIKLKKIAL